jgi:peptidoglycan hydrolase-like protein with peptidoglycan-binding domain
MKLGTILRSLIYEDVNERAFTPHEVFIFKFLHKKKDSLQTKDDYIRVLQTILRAAGLPKEDALYYYTMFLLNMRPDGRYEETTADQVKDFSGEKGKRTTNYKMSDFAKMKMPFEGSNVRGFWEKDPKGVKQFVITSYNWYPIYISKNGVWYKVSDSYSSTTSRQMYQTRILGNQNLSPQMMNQLRNGVDIEEIKKKQREEFLKELNQKFAIKDYVYLKTYFSGDWYRPIKIKFSINYIDEQDGNILIDLDIHEIRMVDNRNGNLSTLKSDELDDEKIRSIKDSLESNLPYKLPKEIRTTSKIEIIPNFKLE